MTPGTPLDRFPRRRIASAIKAGLSFFVLGAITTLDNDLFAQDSTDDAAGDAADMEEDDSVLEEVVITGFRSSLMTSQDLKRNSDVVMDSVTAEDMGALPDRSVTEALQRIPGVSINRFAAGRDPDHFSVEGSGLVIRGLTYVRSEINGRESFTANNGRGLSFAAHGLSRSMMLSQ